VSVSGVLFSVGVCVCDMLIFVYAWVVYNVLVILIAAAVLLLC